MLYVESKEAAKALVSQLDPGISVGAMKSTSKYNDNVCDITTRGASRPHVLDHHVFDNTTERWVKRQSLPQPSRRLVAKLLPSDYDSLKIARCPRNAQCTIEGMPDTGCQSCLSGVNILHKLGMSRDTLIPVSQRMQAANKSGIHILGANLLELPLPDSDAVTKQMIYVTPNVTRLFLSREACADLGLIPSKFPSTSAGAVSSIPNSLLQWRYVSADARLVHCHHLVPFPCLSPPRKRTGASWNSTCGRYSKGPHSMHVPTNLFP